MVEKAVPGQQPMTESRYRQLPPSWKRLLVLATILTVSVSVNQLFNLGHFVGIVALDTQYSYALLAILLPFTFILFPARREANHAVPWYDVGLAGAALAINFYFLWYARDIVDLGWEYAAPGHIQYASMILWALVLEATRRAGGLPVFIVVLVASLYPMYAELLPAPFDAISETFGVTVAYHAVSSESIFGVPFRAFADIVIGFLMFGVAMQHTGGGRFLLNIAFAMFGHARGGPAKVAIFASGLMGSMSGSVITNVLTTGALSIPAMKRIGIKPSVAAGIEACASTGGVLMPPMMGATAFIMATYLNVSYAAIIVAALIPSFLYFFGLFVQIDAYAASAKLQGLRDEELPSVRETFKEGWHYVAVFIVLIWMLTYLQREVLAPYIATGILIGINQSLRKGRWGMTEFAAFVLSTGRLFVELSAILAGIGMIVGALSLTGKISTIAIELLAFAGDSVILLLCMGAVASFVMGIGVTVTVAYIVLAITLAPALTGAGLNPMAVHLFMLYWGMLSFITPPVALGAFAAASLAQARPMETGFQAMRLGSVIYFIPFFFVLNPALIMQGPVEEIVLVFVSALAGIMLIAAGLQGYLIGAGALPAKTAINWLLRIGLVVSGLLLVLPGGKLTGYSHLHLIIAAALMGVPSVLAIWMINRSRNSIGGHN